jgi:hypothetical protein
VQKADVEIDHNGISLWRDAGVMVLDGDGCQPGNLITRDNAGSVWVRDNYIHHNQHRTGDIGSGHGGGHGVDVDHGAYAPGDHECGTAGEYMDIEYNTVWNGNGSGVKLRGAPADKMGVRHNVFVHCGLWGPPQTPCLTDAPALTQNEVARDARVQGHA